MLRLLCVLLRVAGCWTILFSVVDDHLHLLVDHPRPGRLGGALRIALAAAFPHRTWQAARVRPVESGEHLGRLIPYLLRQASKHGLNVSDATWPGSCFPDLVGARLLSDFDRTRLPRVSPRSLQRDFYTAVGLDPYPLVPVHDEGMRAAGMARVAGAACRVFGRADLHGNQAAAVSARALASKAGALAGHKRGVVASFLGVTRQAALRLAKKSSPAALQALRLRLALEDRVASQSHKSRWAS